MAGMFGGRPATPAPVQVPVVAEPTVMPIPDDEAMKRRKKKSLAEQQSRGGRMSTILSTDEKLGG